jgi:hypothetical protein
MVPDWPLVPSRTPTIRTVAGLGVFTPIRHVTARVDDLALATSVLKADQAEALRTSTASK